MTTSSQAAFDALVRYWVSLGIPEDEARAAALKVHPSLPLASGEDVGYSERSATGAHDKESEMKTATAIAAQLVDEDFDKFDGLSSSPVLQARFLADPLAYGGTTDQAEAVLCELLAL